LNIAITQSALCDIVSRQSFRRAVHYDTSLPTDLVSILWADPASLVARGKPLQAKGARQTVRLEWNSRSFVLKHYREPTRRHALKQLILPSRAWRTWNFTRRLVEAGIATPRPVACVENRWGVLRRDSFLMYPYVEGRTLRTCIAEDAKQSPTVRDRLWHQIHELWERLLELHVSLGDTNLGNFIVTPAGQIWLIDLDKSRFHRVAQAAAPHQERAWKQLLRSAAYYD
jgi:tRNA A-37 threonylcarbamoyl transferase component Bud32